MLRGDVWPAWMRAVVRQHHTIAYCLYVDSTEEHCRAVVADDGTTVTTCRRCCDLLDLLPEEVFDAHVKGVGDVLEVVVGDGAPAGEEVGEDAGVDAGRRGELLDGPSLFDHVLAEGGVGGEGSSHVPKLPEVLE